MGKQEVLEALQAKKDVKAAVIASEKHEDGTPHIHAYVLLHKRFNCRDPLFWDLQGYHGNYQKAKSIDSVIRYIKKDGDILEFGEISWAEKIDSRQEHRRYLGKRLMEEPLEDIVRDDPSLMFGLTRLRQDVNTWKQLSLKPYTAPDCRGIWIYGPSRIGKSHFVRAAETDPVTAKLELYVKAQNKWWDGYEGEKAVLIDDMDSDCLAHYLKIWADKYACTGEVKGGHVPLCHERLYVTSNFSIDELFKDLPEVTREAINRRFKTIHMVDRDLSLIKLPK